MASAPATTANQADFMFKAGDLTNEDLKVVSISGREQIRKKVIFTFAGDPGLASEGVSAFPREVTAHMGRNFVDQGAAINALARHAGADVIVVDMGVDHDFGRLGGLLDRKVGRATANFTHGPAMSRAEALRCLETGIALACSCPAAGIDLVGTGAIGVASTTSSAALATVFTGLARGQGCPPWVHHRCCGTGSQAPKNSSWPSMS